VVLLKHCSNHFKALCCNVGKATCTFGAQLFELEAGTYRITLGIDTNADDQPEKLVREDMVAVERGTELQLDLEPGYEYILELEQVAKSKEWTSRADAAVCSRDVFAVPAAPQPGSSAILKVRVHNIGTEDAAQVTVWAEELGTGNVIGERTIVTLPRPHNMVPSHTMIQMPWTVGPEATGVRVLVDAANVIKELYEGNNTAEIELSAIPEGPRQKRTIFIPEWWAQEQKGPVATYTAPYVGKITMDGRIDEEEWKKAERRGPLKDLGDNENEKQTFVRIAYGPDAIYFAIEAQEPDMDCLVEQATEHDSHDVFGDDAPEIFIDTNLDKRTYYQFAFTTSEIKAEGQYYNFSLYNDPWDCKVDKGKDFWTAETRIPYSSLKATPHPGQTWGINVYRNTMTFRVPESEAERRKGWKTGERNALSPTFGGHHEPHRFAAVTFGPKP